MSASSATPVSSLSASIPGALIFLRNGSPSLTEELSKRLDGERRPGGPSAALAPADIRITDFDGAVLCGWSRQNDGEAPAARAP